MAHSVLIVEDDLDLARNLFDFLEIKGYLPDHAANIPAARRLVCNNTYDLLVLDVGLPGGDGVALCRQVRTEYKKTMPIVMLTARDDLDSKLTAFDFGADDYVVKPTALKEIEARIRALIRRSRREVENDILEVGDLRMENGSMRVERSGTLLNLPPLPLKILHFLMARSPNVVLRAAIQQEIWGDEPADAHSLIVHMHTLRSIVDKPFERQLIHTVRGFGYRISNVE